MGAKEQRRQLEERIAQFYKERAPNNAGKDVTYVLLMVESEPRPGTIIHDAVLTYSGDYTAVMTSLETIVALMKEHPERWGEEINLRPEKQN